MDVAKHFCNVPWFEVHINADGTYHSCGAQPNRVSGTDLARLHNVFNMPIEDWVNGLYQCDTRLAKLAGHEEPLCSMCYHEENIGSSSKRIKENHKSDISVVNFYDTFASSKHHEHFKYSQDNGGKTDIRPVSYHISLGNECNLACRMCTPWASSKIAVEQIKLGYYHGPAKQNWTDNDTAWNNVVDYICNTDTLEFVHLIGGEPLLNPKFEDFVDRLIAGGRTDIYLGFTTNGTIFNHSLINKLNQFRHVDIGISIECVGVLNDYIRQGSTTDTVLKNIEEYLKYRKEGHVYVTVRPVPSALSVHTIDDLYKWCLDRKLDVMTNILVNPEFMQISNLPQDVKNRLLAQFNRWHFSEPEPGEFNPRDPNRYREHIDSEIKAIITALQQPAKPNKTKELYEKLALWHWLSNEEIAKYFETIGNA